MTAAMDASCLTTALLGMRLHWSTVCVVRRDVNVVDGSRGWHGKILSSSPPHHHHFIQSPPHTHYHHPRPHLSPPTPSPLYCPIRIPACLSTFVSFPSPFISFGFAFFSAFSILYDVFVLRQEYCNKNMCSTEWPHLQLHTFWHTVHWTLHNVIFL